MDIIFINPPLTLKERFGKFAPAGNIMPPLGLCYLASVCREKGLKTEIIDAPAEGLDVLQTKDRVVNKNPRFVGITATTLSILNASKVAESIKNETRDIVIVIGGPHISSVPEGTLTKYPNFDFGVIGEGEETIIDLIYALKGNYDVENVKGVIYRNKNGFHRTARRENIEELDSLPLPAWDLLPNYPYSYKPLEIAMSDRLQGSIITSRGCPYNCSYCPKSVFGRTVRKHSIGRVIEMIREQYDKYNVRDLEIYDDVLILSRDRIIELSRQLIAERFNLVWSCNSTIGSVDRETLELMKKAGCWKIAFGIESGDQRILKFMNKHLNLDKASEVLRISKKVGFVNRGYFIIGFPTETKESIRKTVNFAKKADLDIVQFNSFTPLPGSPIYDTINQYGKFDNNWDKMNFVNSVFIPDGFDKEMLEKIIQNAYKEFYLRPKIILSFLRRIKKISSFYNLFKNFLAFLKIVHTNE
ncbi:MAG: radical SAM protein [Candidatus Omnitrophica bacterium]|nr:radical SAM protein [Candidatus Omnitrophota bacterium]MDD5591927.1 radical SAM protein [Candidatus Omnitrophota bacterium]